jgi:hypothetical protein
MLLAAVVLLAATAIPAQARACRINRSGVDTTGRGIS